MGPVEYADQFEGATAAWSILLTIIIILVVIGVVAVLR